MEIVQILLVNTIAGIADSVLILNNLGSQSTHGGRLDGILGDGSALHDILLKDLCSAAGQVADYHNDFLVLQRGIDLVPVGDLTGEDLPDGIGVNIVHDLADRILLVDGDGQSVRSHHILGVTAAQGFLLAVLHGTSQHTEVGSAVQHAGGAVAGTAGGDGNVNLLSGESRVDLVPGAVLFQVSGANGCDNGSQRGRTAEVDLGIDLNGGYRSSRCFRGGGSFRSRSSFRGRGALSCTAGHQTEAKNQYQKQADQFFHFESSKRYCLGRNRHTPSFYP